MFAYYAPSFLALPRYYYLADPAYWNLDEYEGHESLYGLISERFPFTTLVVPRACQDTARRYDAKCKIWPYDPIPEIPVYRERFYEGISTTGYSMPGVQTVTHLMLYHAILLGYSQIYLIGVELDDWKNVQGSPDGIQAACFSHYYDGLDPDTSRGKLFGPKNRDTHLSDYNYLRLLEDGYRAIKGFYNLARFASSMGAEIVNLSVESWLDCFPKIDPSSLS